MAGLISTSIRTDDPTKGIVGYDPEKIALDADKDTVAGQIKNIIGEDSPLIQGARTRATQESNRRGLMNSSIAVGAGESAVHNVALPIAQQDAQTHFQAKQLNQNAGNTANQFTAGATNTGAGQVLQGQQTKELSAQDAAQREKLLAQQSQTEKELQTLKGGQETDLTKLRGTLDVQLQALKGDQASRLTQMEADNKGLLQTSASATTLYTNIANNMSKIMADTNLTPEDKQIAIDRHIDFIQGGLAIIGSVAGYNLTELLSF